MTEPASLALILLVAAAVGAAAGAVGIFMVLRRMALVGDALTHVALPGIGVALALGFSPFLGGFALLLAAVLGIWFLQERTRVYSEAIVGLFFTVSLAVGIIVTENPELFEALFGDIADITPRAALLSSLAAIGTIAVTARIAPSLLLSTIAPDLAQTHGIRRRRVNLLFFLLVALIVALGIGIVGTLLMGSLVIMPAITAKHIGGSFRRFAAVSIAGGAVSAVLGILLSSAFPPIPPGAAVTLIGALLFLCSFPFRQHD